MADLNESEDFAEIEDATLVCSTHKAGLFRIEDKEHWIPWSQVLEGSIETDGEIGVLYISEWIANQKGINW